MANFSNYRLEVEYRIYLSENRSVVIPKENSGQHLLFETRDGHEGRAVITESNRCVFVSHCTSQMNGTYPTVECFVKLVLNNMGCRILGVYDDPKVVKKDQWCKCFEDDHLRSRKTNGLITEDFSDDGQCSCGVNKHHYHCSHCGLITQIG